MFRSFFNALSRLTAAATAMAQTFEEGNSILREKLMLDAPESPPVQIEAKAETADEPQARNGRARAKA